MSGIRPEAPPVGADDRLAPQAAPGREDTTGEGRGLGSGPFGLVLPGLLIAFLVARTAAPVRDQDTFWHVVSGRDLLDGGSLSGSDPLSGFTTDPWIKHAWLPDLVFALADRAGGPRAVALLLPVMTALALVALYVALRRRGGNVLLSCVLLATAFLGMAGSLSARPQVLSFAFTAVVGALWLRAEESSRPPWAVVPLTWLWASCHGLWLLSPLIGGAVTVAMIVARRPPRVLARMAAVVAASASVAALTPLGPPLLLAPLRVGEVTGYIQEWQPPELLSGPVVAVAALVALTVTGWLVRRRPGTPAEVVLLLACLPLALTARRTVGIAAVLAALVAVRALDGAVPLRRDRVRRAELVALGVWTAVGVCLSWLLVLAAPATSGFPGALTKDLDALPRGTVVCNDYAAGSWLLWSSPGLVPVLDGRTELYSAAQLEAALVRTADADAWGQLTDAVGCRAALVLESGPGARYYSGQPEWDRVGSSDGWALFVRSVG